MIIIKHLHNADLINPIEYKQAIEYFNAETIIGYDENNNVVPVKTKGLLRLLDYYSHFELVKCYIKRDFIKVCPVIVDDRETI